MTAARILAVEDSRTQGEALRADLRAAGFDVTLTRSGEDALERFDVDSFDLVVSDIVMPGMDGYDLCRELKNRQYDLPVVLLTSLRDPLDVVRGLEAGADNFLRKPYEASQLVARLQSILYNRQLRGSGRASMGIELFFLNRRFTVTAERQQILDLLVSTFEDLVVTNEDLRQREQDLAATHEALADQLAAVELERQRLRTVLAAVPEPTAIIDAAGTVTDASDAWSRLGVHPEDILGRPASEVADLLSVAGQCPGEHPHLDALLAKGQPVDIGGAYEVLFNRPDGTSTPVIVRAAPVCDSDDEPAGAVAVVSEIGEAASHDPLTSLPTHALFSDRLARTGGATRAGEPLAVLAVVLDRFSELRAMLGPAGTDALVAGLAAGIREVLAQPEIQALAPGAFAAYLGGDEFVVALPDLGDEIDAVRVGQLVCDQVRPELTLDAADVALRASVGIAFATAERRLAIDLVPDATAAARRAAATGGWYEIFDPAVHRRATERLEREAELKRAIERDELRLAYQPVLLMNGATSGVEALVRWEHPELGLLPPAEFISLAEETGLVVELGWWVLDEACRQAASWRRTLPGAEDLTVAVNLSVQQLDRPEAVDRVRAALDRTGLEPAALMLEITEAGVMAEAPASVERLRALKALGVKLAVDDFGTGYSSLSYLRRFPLDALKVDRGFVAGMASQAEDAAIVAGTIRLGHALGLHVVAEGVETAQQLAQLRQLGCDFGQGFHWSRPLEPRSLEQWWRAQGHHGGTAEVHALDNPEEAALEVGRDDALAYLVHELRTPITVLSGYAQLLRQHPERIGENDMVEHLDRLARSAGDLQSRLVLMTELRDLEQGAMQLEMEACDVSALVESTLADLGDDLRDHQLEAQEVQGLAVRVDATRVCQALANLVGNAAKFAPPRTTIEIAATRTGPHVEVSVRDHGPGVLPGRASELFRRFARLGSSERGTGLGLYLAKAIARAHGGDLRHEAPADGGARFVLTLPAADATAGAR